MKLLPILESKNSWDQSFLKPEEVSYGKYNMVPFHELSREARAEAIASYPHKSTGAIVDFKDEHYYYPVKKDGSLANADRALAIPYDKLRDESYLKSLGYTQIDKKYIKEAKTLGEDDHIDFKDYSQLSYYDPGGNFVDVYVDDNLVGKMKVWKDKEEEGREYLTINHEIVYLDTIKEKTKSSIKESGEINDGDLVQATKEYGGKKGTVVDAATSKNFAKVEHEDGTFGYYHVSDLTKLEHEDNSNSVNERKGDLSLSGISEAKVGLKFYLKERNNPQLSKPYYIRCGQLTKAEAKKKESTSYGDNIMLAFDTEEEYNNEIKRLESEGFRVGN